MKLLSCNTMRDGILVSGAFLLLGAALIFLVAPALPQAAYLPLITYAAGFITVLLAPVVLISTFVATVWPGSKKNLDSCDH